MGFLLMAQFVGRLLVQLVEVLVLLAVSQLAWGVGLLPSPAVLGSLALCVLGMYGVGLTLAGLSLLFKRVGSMLTLVQICLLFVTDTLPTPPVLSAITSFLPLTLCNEILREAASGGCPTAQIAALCCLSLAWLVVGYAVFVRIMSVSRRRGTLLFY